MYQSLKSLFTILVIIAVILVLGRVFLFKLVRIDSYDMVPNLVAGDYFLVFTRDTLGPGSVAVCHHPDDPSTMVALRVVGVPGSTFAMRGSNLILNGKPVDQERANSILYVDNNSPEYTEYEVVRAQEYVGGHRYEVGLNDEYGENAFSHTKVEEGFFLLGDNRNMAQDSRSFEEVPLENCIGSAFLVIWPGPDSGDLTRLNRILKWID